MSFPDPVVRLDLLPGSRGGPDEVAIVVDALRMTTTATVLAELGLRRLTVVADVQRARRLARTSGALLLGERNARALPGFDGGNSPLELSGLPVRGRDAVLCTTNGSAAVESCVGARHLLLGCLRNASAVARRALDLAGPGGVRLVCAGTEGAVSLDDVAAAGRIAVALAAAGSGVELDDAALVAAAVASADAAAALLRRSRHGRRLEAEGFVGDVLEAARVDVTGCVLERAAGSASDFVAAPPEPTRAPGAARR